MNRRQFIWDLGAGAAGLAASSCTAAASKQVQVRVDAESPGASVPADFAGFGYEISSVATPGLLSARNQKYVQLLRTISTEGVIRIGGNTTDFAAWSADGDAIASPKGTVVNKASVQELGGFLKATGWKLIWALNLGTGTAEAAADEAAAVSAAAGDRLLCFEIGNEPDLFVASGHRPQGFGYKQYLEDYRRFAAVLRARLPGTPLAGPDVLVSPEWVSSFAADEGKAAKLLTAHFYASVASDPAATIENLLKSDQRLFLNRIAVLRNDSESAGIPYRMVELNSFSGGGKPGVSDTFASALWGLDLMFTLASARGAGINWETGVNHLGFVSSYSPIFDDEHGGFTARPLYYALLAFRGACGGRLIDAAYDPSGINFKAWAFRDRSGQLWAALINKDLSTAAEVEIQVPSAFLPGEILRLSAPAVDSKTGITFAGSEVSAAGTWSPARRERVQMVQGKITVALPAASAALVGFRDQPRRTRPV